MAALRTPSRTWARLGALLVVLAALSVAVAAREAAIEAVKEAKVGIADASSRQAIRDFRLPGDVLPSNYTLRIVTHFQVPDNNFWFSGQAVIDVDVVRDTSVLRLHAKKLQVDRRTVTIVPLQEDEDSNGIPDKEEGQSEGQKEDQQVEDQKQEIPTVEEQKPEDPKGDDKKPEDPKIEESKPEVVKIEGQKPEDSKIEEQRPEDPKPEDPKPEVPKVEDQKTEEPKPEVPKVEDQKTEDPMINDPKVEEPKPDVDKVEAQKPDDQNAGDQKPEIPTVEEQKLEDPKGENQKLEGPKLEEQKPDDSKVEEQRPENPMIEDQKQENPMIETSIQDDATKPDYPKGDAQNQNPDKLENVGADVQQNIQQELDLKQPQGEQKVEHKPNQEQKLDDKQGQDDQNQGDQKEDKIQTTQLRRRRQGHYEHRPRDAEFRGVRIFNVSMDAGLQQLVITLSEPLRAGRRYRITVDYWGTLNTEDRGYFRGSYQRNNQTRWVSSTVFEPAEARRAFPCFDEPHMKANFSLVLGRHRNFSSSANMPLDRTEPMQDTPGWWWDHYRTSPKMSTYLVAFMVHDLEGSVLRTEAAGVPFRAWAIPGRVQEANYSLWVAPQVMTTLTSLLGTAGPLPKHDLVAAPGFKSEALENWGLVSFEEHHLLLPPNASQLSKQSVSSVVAHELAHSWFGNLITPAWWSDIWLSEGFATYYSAEALQQVFPSWKFHETAAGNAYLLVTYADASPNSMPVIQPADNPDKLGSVFGTISYYKGYWLLRMLEATLGAGVFEDGVRRYVRRHVYSSVRTQDLWDALQEAVEERAELDLQAASSIQAEDVVVVGDDSEEEEDLVRVVLPGESKPKTSPPAALPTTAPTNSARLRSRRDAGKAPIAQIVMGVPSTLDKDSSESSELEDPTDSPPRAKDSTNSKDAPGVDVPGSSKTAHSEALAEPLDAKKVPAIEDVQSPPRRGPGPSGFYGKVGWLPRPIDQIMKSWVTQPGIPLVYVHRNLETGTVTLNQRRYLSPASPSAAPCNASSTWWIPVRWSTTSKGAGVGPVSESVFWMPPTCANVTMPIKVPREDWLTINAGLNGLYRVRYDPRTLQQVSRLPRANWLQMAPLTRMQLVADSLDLARAGRQPYQHVLRLVDHIGRDPNPLVWRAALPHLIMLQRQLRARRDGVALRSWLQDLVSPHAASIGFTTRAQDSPAQASLRYKVTTLACLADHGACQRKAKKALKQFIAGDTDAIPAGRLTATQLCAAIRWGSPADWRFLRAQLSNPASTLPRKAVLSGLGCSRDQETLRSFLADTMDLSLRRSDVATILSAVAANEAGTDIVLRFLEEQAAPIYSRLGGLPRAEKEIREIAESLNTKKQLERLNAVLRHFQSHVTTRSPLTWGRDIVRENIRWSERSRAEVSRWLRARVDSDDLELELRGTSKTAVASDASPTAHNVTAPNATAHSTHASKNSRKTR